MKILVETTGEFDVLDLMGKQVVHSYRPCVVELTPYIDAQLGGNLRRLEVLTDEASDESLATAKDLDAAVAALPRPEAKPRTTKKG